MIDLVNLETVNDAISDWIAPLEKREELSVGMFAGVLATEPRRPRPSRLWLKIVGIEVLDGDVTYLGELALDTILDIELGTRVMFGPEHVLEWSTHTP